MTCLNTNPQSVKCLMHSQQLPHVLCGAGALIMGCFAPVLAVKGRLHRALDRISICRLCHADETYKAETAVQGCHYLLGDVAVCMPDRGLLFEYVTCFYCLKGVRLCQMCANSRKKKQDDPPPWVAENLHGPPLTKGSKTDDPPPLCSSPPPPPPPNIF